MLELSSQEEPAYQARKAAIESAQEPALKVAALRALGAAEERRSNRTSARRFYVEADAYARMALELAMEPESQAVALRARADLLRLNGKDREALAAYRQSLDIALDPAMKLDLEKVIKALEIRADLGPGATN